MEKSMEIVDARSRVQAVQNELELRCGKDVKTGERAPRGASVSAPELGHLDLPPTRTLHLPTPPHPLIDGSTSIALPKVV